MDLTEWERQEAEKNYCRICGNPCMGIRCMQCWDEIGDEEKPRETSGDETRGSTKILGPNGDAPDTKTQEKRSENHGIIETRS